MAIYSESNVFCDFLTVTQRPDDNSLLSVGDLLLTSGAVYESFNAKEGIYRFPKAGGDSGAIKVLTRSSFVSLSATGQALAHLRVHKIFDDYLSLLTESPHKVTRLDATKDVYRDAPDVLDELRSTYPEGKINMSRKAIDTSLMLSIRGDGRETGTYYAGHRSGTSARVTARVYDKQWERLQRAGLEIPPTTRYEITFGRDYGCTLADAHDPSNIFYNHCSPLLLSAPAGTTPWLPYGSVFAYQPEKMVKKLPANALFDLVSSSADFETMIRLARSTGSQGETYLLRLIQDRVKKAFSTGSTLV